MDSHRLKQTILIGISGSIAAYKSIDLVKLLIENGFEVEIVLSSSAADFISPLTLRSLFPGKVHLSDDLLGENDEMLHISLAKAADLILIAPASANMIAKVANGMADCLLSTICLATKAPIMIAPAMNKVMWENEFVQANIAKLKNIIGPASGKQACGDEGLGRMVEPVEIVEYVKNFNVKKILKSEKIVITAGPTLEKIDPVRFIGNYSSGKMGYAIAAQALIMGAEVTLISGPTNCIAKAGIKVIKVESADEMQRAALIEAKNCDVFIGAAAIADYSPKEYCPQKMKKKSDNLTVHLKQNPDVIASVKRAYNDVFVVGFAAETNDFHEHGLKKLQAKNIDMIAINDVSDGKVFGMDDNELHVITKAGETYNIDRNSKDKVAQELLKIITKYIRAAAYSYKYVD